MAKLYPAIFPTEPNPHDPEFIVFELLKKLPDKFHVFYSKKFKGAKRAKEEVEIDFLIFDGSSSMICLEVKGGIIGFDGSQNHWTQNSKIMEKGPDRQASAANAAALDFLSPEARDLNFGWALCFPQCSLSSQTSTISEVPRQIIVDEAQTLDIEESIEKIRDYYIGKYKKSGVTKFSAHAILKKLTRSLQFVTKIGVRVARDSKQIAEVTQEQYQLLENLMLNPRLMVQGAAGSGKTMMAQEFARRLLNEGNRVLLLFYNREISRQVSRGFDRDSKITCATFHSFARRTIEKKDPHWWNQQEKGQSFWEETLPLKLLDFEYSEDERYDAIIVDEGQDFKSDWFSVLENFLEDIDKSHFAVFYDENQDIFERWGQPDWSSRSVFKWRLTKNCRNTQEIVDHINRTCGTVLNSYEKSPQGLKVQARKFSSASEELEAVKANVKKLVTEGVDPTDIILILNSDIASSCLGGTKKIAGLELASIRDRDARRGRKLRYTTIDTFKGLEADVVFVLDLHLCPTDASRKREYTQFSRATSLLFTYATTE